MENRTNPAPWRIEGQAIRDANGDVVVSAINPCDMNTRRLIVHAVNAGFWLREGNVKSGSLKDIWEEMCELSRSSELATGASYCQPQPTVHGKPINFYFSEIADRIKDAAWHEERLMLSLMLYAVEDYVEDWASEKFKKCVRAACERLGIEYCPNASCLQGRIVNRITAMDGETDQQGEFKLESEVAHA